MKPRSTKRITFRALEASDADLLDALNNAPGVMKYLERNPPTLEHLVTHTIPQQLRIARENPGYGLWLAYLRDTDSCIGWFELEPNRPHAGDAEIGYRLFPEHWGQGLATEGAQELVRYAFDDLAAERCVSITMAVNRPSRKVMERIGLRYIRTFHQEFIDPLPGTEQGEVEYALSREEWLLRRA